MSERSNATSRRSTTPLKWHIDGGKGAFNGSLAKWIISLMPPRCKNPNKPSDDDPGWLHYVEPYFGGGSVLLANDPEGISEVANDINRDLMTFWQVMASEELFQKFQRRNEATPFSKDHWQSCEEAISNPDIRRVVDDPVDWAHTFFVWCRQSLAGRMDSFASITRNRTRRGMNEQVSAWLKAIDGLPEVHARLRRVLMLNDDALTVIRKEDGERSLFYIDCPYLHETRSSVGEYEHEMTYQQHRDLLEVLKVIKGRFLLSGYDSDLYRGYANTVPRWNRHDFRISNNAAGGGNKKVMTESIWCNY
jgi:DNA adenine methylase